MIEETLRVVSFKYSDVSEVGAFSFIRVIRHDDGGSTHL
jgi:hypothetical protein